VNRLLAQIATGFATIALASAARGQSTTVGRYGFLNALDHDSRYGQYWFPEPFRAPEMDVDNEFRLDWLHTEKRGHVADSVTAEIEKSFGLLTLEIEAPYQRETLRETDFGSGGSFMARAEGIGSIEVAARHPIYQWVSPNQFFDFTLAAALETAIPTTSEVGKDFEIVPQLFALVRVGEHFSIQSSVGYSTLVGPDDGGKQTLEYSAVFGWALEQEDLHLPGAIQRIVPEFELIGERGLNNGETANELSGTIGVRVNLDSIGPLQPRLGAGYVFPIDQDARNDFRWGVITSIVFEY
jgi:hypothetical protein